MTKAAAKKRRGSLKAAAVFPVGGSPVELLRLFDHELANIPGQLRSYTEAMAGKIRAAGSKGQHEFVIDWDGWADDPVVYLTRLADEIEQHVKGLRRKVAFLRGRIVEA